MPNLSLKLKQTFCISVPVEFTIDFDTSTGLAEVTSGGRVTSHPEHLTRRQILEIVDLRELDVAAYTTLIENGTIPTPAPGDKVVLHERNWVIDPEAQGIDPNAITDHLLETDSGSREFLARNFPGGLRKVARRSRR